MVWKFVCKTTVVAHHAAKCCCHQSHSFGRQAETILSRYGTTLCKPRSMSEVLGDGQLMESSISLDPCHDPEETRVEEKEQNEMVDYLSVVNVSGVADGLKLGPMS